MRAWLVLLFGLGFFSSAAAALDDTSPRLRWGLAFGLSGSLPVGDLRASASRDEFVPGLWLDLEPLQFDVGDHLNVTPVARFVLVGGMNPEVLDQALDPARRRDATGKRLSAPEVQALELGFKGRYFPWGAGRWRPYAALGLGYATTGAVYEVSAAAGATGSNARPVANVHRHHGLATRIGVGLRGDTKFRAFKTDMLLPVALELAYIHHTWLGLERSRRVETRPELVAGEGPFLDYVGLSLTAGFLR